MIKLQFSIITIMFLCTMTPIASTSKDHKLVGKKNTQKMEELLNLVPNQSQYEQGLQNLQDTFEKVPNKTSKYTGVHWNRYNKKWQVQLLHNKKKYYGGLFDNEEHAAMSVNLLCDKKEIDRKNWTINIQPDKIQQQCKNKTSKYTGVCWQKSAKKWKAGLMHNNKHHSAGLFGNEEHAAMEINLLCDKNGIERKNSMITIESDATQQQFKNQTSIYAGVCWNRNSKKWQARLMHNRKLYCGGYFDNEEHAAMSVNLLCDKNEIKRKHPKIIIDPDAMPQVRNQSSKYTGVYWHKDTNKWQAHLKHHKNLYYGGLFNNEQQAAMKVNLLCDKYGIKRKNPMIDLKPDAMQQKTKSKINQSKKENVVKTEEESILYGLKDKCEKNYMKSRDDSIITESYKSQKRKRKENSIINDDLN